VPRRSDLTKSGTFNVSHKWANASGATGKLHPPTDTRRRHRGALQIALFNS